VPHSRTCPVCLTPNSIIRPDAKTCSRDCSKAWNKMSRLEQQARLRTTNPSFDQQVEALSEELFGQVDRPTRDYEADSLPPGILPDK
jgi:predicted nucleic acid-binding Zn ribbon protein